MGRPEPTRRQVLAGLGLATLGTGAGTSVATARRATADTWPFARHGRRGTAATTAPGPTSEPVEVWRSDEGYTVSTVPVVRDGLLFAGSGFKRLQAHEAATGEVIWSHDLGAFARTPAAVADGMAYVVDERSTVHAIAADTGTEQWTESFGNIRVAPVVGAGNLYLAGQPTALRAVDPASGASVWQADAGQSVDAVPAVADGTVHFARGRLRAVDAATGRQQWTAPLPTTNDNRAYDGTVAIADGRLYVRSLDGDENARVAAYALDGTRQWETELTGFTQPPTVSDGTVYLAGTEHLTALNANDGSTRWERRTFPRLRRPAVATGTHLFVVGDGTLHAVDPASGDLAWTYSPGGTDVVTRPAVVGTTLFLGTGTGVIALGEPGATPTPGGRTPVPTETATPAGTATPTSTSGGGTPGDVTVTPTDAATPTTRGAGLSDGSGTLLGGDPRSLLLPGLAGTAVGIGVLAGAHRMLRGDDEGPTAADDGGPETGAGSGDGSPGDTGPAAGGSTGGTAVAATGTDAADAGLSFADFERETTVGEGRLTTIDAVRGPDGNRYALETLRGEETLSREMVEGFADAATDWSKFADHPHVTSVVARGTSPVPWVTMPAGTPLSAGDVPVVATLAACCEGVYQGHRHGRTHGALAPTNVVLVGADDRPTVADWGTDARSLAGAADPPRHPVAPEQRRDGTVDVRTDVFGLGALGCWLATGEWPCPPAAVTDPDRLRTAVDDALDPVDTTLAGALRTALAPDPAARHETALHLKDALPEPGTDMRDR